jgi:HEAT repeat protein
MPMVKILSVLKTDKSWRERRRAARLLRKAPSDAAIQGLMEAVDDFDDEVAQTAIMSLIYLNHADVTRTITKHRFLLSKNSVLRWTVAHALSKFGNKSHFEFLLRMSLDSDWSVRDEVFSAFDRILTGLVEELDTADKESADMDSVSEDVHLLIRMLQIRQKSVRKKIYPILVSAFQHLSIDPLLEALTSENVLIKTGVINVLGLLGRQDTVSYLAKHAAAVSVPVRLEVVKNVRLIGGPEAINILISRLGDGEVRVVSAAKDALVQLKNEPHFADILIDRLNFIQNVNIRQNILQVMGRTGGTRVIPLLFVNIGSPYYFIRQAATRALVNYKDMVYERVLDVMAPAQISIAPFLKMCKDAGHVQVRLQGIELLGKSKDPYCIKVLEELLADPSKEIVAAADEAMENIFKSNWERANCAHILGEIGNPNCVGALLKALTDWSIEVRSEAVGALRKLRTVPSPEAIIQAFKVEKDAPIRSELIACLGDVGQINALTKPVIVAAMADKSQLVRQQAARALRFLDQEDETTGLLINHLADESVEVRTACVNSLYALGEHILHYVRDAFAVREEYYVKFNCLNLIGLLRDLTMEPAVTRLAEQEDGPLTKRAKIVLRTLKNNREADREILFAEHE